MKIMKCYTEFFSQITVTLKMEWNVTVVGKSIPADYITKVKNGTVLEDILNKAADEDSQGPFNKYDSTYHAGLGYSITAMNGIKHSTGTYWLIFDEQTGGGIPCGITSYVPQDNSTTIFRLTATFGHSGSVSGYCKLASSNSQVRLSYAFTVLCSWSRPSLTRVQKMMRFWYEVSPSKHSSPYTFSFCLWAPKKSFFPEREIVLNFQDE